MSEEQNKETALVKQNTDLPELTTVKNRDGKDRLAARQKGKFVKTANAQSLMRHANINVTMDRYVQAVTPAKRAAQRSIAGLLDPNGPTMLKSNTASC